MERLHEGHLLPTMGGGGGRAGVDGGVESKYRRRLWRWGWRGAEGADGRWGRNGTTTQRASSPDDGRRRGRVSSSAEAGGAEILMM
jgi:hypothetical protein